jgi:serine/threonine protein kinase
VSNRLEDALEEWEDRRERGEPVSLDQFCANWPDIRDQLLHGIQALEACGRMLHLPTESALGYFPPYPLAPPDRVAGYEVRGELGHGGMGVVYLVWDPALRREAALKMISPSLLSFPGAAERLQWRFLQEAQALARLTHPHIVKVHAASSHEGRSFFVMELVTGGSLASNREKVTRDGPAAILDFMEKVARAVAYAHGQGVLHRDLKPANILIADDGSPRVGDFGLAKLVSEVSEDTSFSLARVQPGSADATLPFTGPGVQPGTAAYMAPEQFGPEFGEVGPTTDVWALGVILYELLTGRRPFAGLTREQLRETSTSAVPHSPALRPWWDSRVEAVVLRCLERNPERRFPSAEALANALRDCRQPRWGLWAVGLVTTLLVLTGIIWYCLPESPEAAYSRANAIHRNKLLNGEAVDLIGPGSGLPPYSIRCGKGVVNVKRTDEGVAITAPVMGIVELLNEIPLKRYRVEAEICHQHAQFRPQGYKIVGIAFRSRHWSADEGTHHVVQMFALDDTTERPLAPPGKPPGVYRNCYLQQLWYIDAPENAADPFLFKTQIVGNNAYYPPEGKRLFRSISIDISPDKVTGNISVEPGDVMGPMVPLADALFRKSLVRTHGELKGLSRQPENQAAVSVVVSGGQCIVRRARVVPLE